MIEFDSVSGENIVTYEKFHLPFRHPLAVLRGPNRSGKSIIPSTIGNLLFGMAPLDNRRGSGSRMHRKGSSITIRGKAGNHTWEFSQVSRGKGLGYRATIDGEVVQLKGGGVEVVRELMAEHVPLNEPQFYTTTMLSSFRGCVLHGGGAPARRSYFEDVFDLGIFDAIQDKLSQRLSTLKGERTRLQMMRERYSELKGRRINLVEAEKIEADLRRRNKVLDSKLEAIGKNITELSSWLALADGLSSGLGSNELVQRQRQLEMKVRAGRELIENAATVLEQQRAAERNRNARETLIREMKALNVRPSEPDLRRAARGIEALSAVLTRFKDRLNRAQQTETLHAQYSDVLKDVRHFSSAHTELYQEMRHRGRSDYASFLNTQRIRLGSVQSTIRSLSNLRERHLKECPSCGQGVHGEHAERVLKGMRQEEARMKTGVDILEVILAKYEIEAEIRSLKEACSSTVLQEVIERNMQMLSEYRAQHARITQALQLQSRIRSIPEVEPPARRLPEGFDLAQTREIVRKYEQQLQTISHDLRLRERLDAMTDFGDPTAARERLRRATQIRNQGMLDLRDLNDKLQRLSSQIASGRLIQEEFDALEQRTAEAEQRLADLPVYDALMAAYGARGLRILQIKNLATMFEANLNSYADLLFGEPFKFLVNVEESRFDILAERSGLTSEIAGSLSGSETSCFQLLCMLSLLPFIPASRRANICVLDEIEKGMDEVSRQLYTTSFLPSLVTVVPRILVVTPLGPQELSLPNGVEYRVNKRGGQSVLTLSGG